jgi:DNA-binding NarL/FixJ family response regulator/HAMP domain-containing protein
MTRRDDSLIGQIVAANVVLFALTLLAASVAAGLDLGASNERWEFMIIALAIVLTLCTNLWMLQRRFRPLERLIDEIESIDPAEPSPLELRRANPVEEIDRLASSFHGLLQRIEEERRRSGQLAMRAQEEERRRLARDLHDEVNQALTAILLRLEALAHETPAERAPEVAELKRLVNQAMDELLNLARQLRPSALDDHGLVPAVETQLKRFGARHPRRARHAAGGRADRYLPGRPGGADERDSTRGRDRGRAGPRGARRGRGAARARRRRRVRPERDRAVGLGGAGRRAGAGGDGRARSPCRRRAGRALRSRRRHDDHAQGAVVIRVLIADDHGIVRSGLRMLIDRQLDMEVVAEADDGVAALESTQSHRPDVAVLDVSMPRMTGLQAAREIRAHVPETRVLLLSMHDDERYFLEGLASGASGYVLKRAADTDLIGAVRTVARGRTFLSGDAQRDLMDEWMEGGRSEPDDPLTPRELEVVKLIAEAYTNRQIAETLKVSEKTVESHRANVLSKLEMRDRVELVRYAIRRGLVEP